mgnify:FL=1
MTLKEFTMQLKTMPSDAELIFAAEGRQISGGYHLTEFKLARIESVDCAARQSAWVEATMQLLDGTGGDFMKVRKFVAIAEKSTELVENLGDVALSVEFSPENAGMRVYDMGAVTLDHGQVFVDLDTRAAGCKPKTDYMRIASGAVTDRPTAGGCCGPATTSCC